MSTSSWAPSRAPWVSRHFARSSPRDRTPSTSRSSPKTPWPSMRRRGRPGVTAVVDCGVAPGMSNMILGYHAARMTVRTFQVLCRRPALQAGISLRIQGALFARRRHRGIYPAGPLRRERPSSSSGRPSRTSRSWTFPRVGTLEAFNSDGLRSLLQTMSVPNMIEKTLRYPGHVGPHQGPARQRLLRHGGDRGPGPEGEAHRRHLGRAVQAVAPSRGGRRVHGHEDRDRRATRTAAAERIVYSLFDRRDRTDGLLVHGPDDGLPGDRRGPPRPGREVLAQRRLPAGIRRRRGGRFQAVMDELAAKNVIYRRTDR